MERSEISMLDTRKGLFQTILRFPGLHFRELQRKTGLAPGSLQYHLSILEKLKVVRGERIGEHLRFYPIDLSAEERILLGLLRQHNIRRIVLCLLTRSNVGYKEFMSELGLSASTISWYLRRLEQSQLIACRRIGGESSYRLLREEEVVRILVAYRQSFLDRLVDRFVSMWETKSRV